MRCSICDRALTEKEVSYNEDFHNWEPCSTCLEIAMDAAYCDGFDREDDSFILLTDDLDGGDATDIVNFRSEEHTSELQSLMRISYADFCLKNKTQSQYALPTKHP